MHDPRHGPEPLSYEYLSEIGIFRVPQYLSLQLLLMFMSSLSYSHFVSLVYPYVPFSNLL